MKRIFFAFTVLFAIVCIADIRIDGGGGGAGGPETDPIAGPALSTHAALSKAVHSIADTSKLLTSENDPVAGPALSTHAGLTKAVHGIADTSALLTSESDPNSLHLNGDNKMINDIVWSADGGGDIGSADGGTTKLRPDGIWAKSSVNIGDTSTIITNEAWIGKTAGQTGTVKLGENAVSLTGTAVGQLNVGTINGYVDVNSASSTINEIKVYNPNGGGGYLRMGYNGGYPRIGSAAGDPLFLMGGSDYVLFDGYSFDVGGSFLRSKHNGLVGLGSYGVGSDYRFGETHLKGPVSIGEATAETGTIYLGPEGTKLEHELGGDPRVVKLTLGSPGHAEFQLGQIGSFWGFSPSLERWKFSNSARNLILDHDAGGGVDSQNKITMYNPPKTQSLTWGFAAPWDGVAYRWVMSTSAGDLNLVPAEGDGAVNVNKYAGKIGTLNLGPGGASIVGTAAGSLTLSPASGQTTTVHGLVEEIERTYSGVADATYTLVRKARFARQIDKVVFLCSLASGIITADLKIDGTAIDGCNALGVTDIEQDFTCTNNATNDLAAATTLTLVTSSNVLCGDLIVGVQTTRD